MRVRLIRKETWFEDLLGGAYEILTLVNGFHGRTLVAMSATGSGNSFLSRKIYWLQTM